MQQVKLDIIPGAVSPRIHVSQYDVGRQFGFEMRESLTSFSIPDGSTISIQGKKPDQHGFSYDNTTSTISYSGSNVSITTTEQMTAVSGIVECELKIVTTDYEIYTCNFIIEVEQAALLSDTLMSDSDITEVKKAVEAGAKLDKALEQISQGLERSTEAVNKAEEAITQTTANVEAAAKSETNAKASEIAAKESETNTLDYSNVSKSYAVGDTGTRDGEDTDNSKYYSELAANSQNAALTSEQAAELAKEAAEEAAKLASETVSGVGSFNGRSGAVNPETGDYTPDMVGTYSKEHIDALHSTAAITLKTDNWSTSTTTIDGGEYYSYSVSGLTLNDIFPIINIGATGTLPTTAEEAAYECIKYVDAKTGSLTFYATTKPQNDIPVLVKGATSSESWSDIAQIIADGMGPSFFQ